MGAGWLVPVELTEPMPRRIFPVYVAIALDMAAFGMAFTDIALRARLYGAAPWLVGILLSSYFLLQIVMAPRWGRISDRLGRKPVAVFCTALSALSMVVYALVPSLLGILASRVLAGLAAANVAVIQASLVDTVGDEDRAGIMGKFSAALNAGLIAGFAGGGFVAEHLGASVVGMLGAALSGGATILLVAAMPSTKPSPRDANEPKRGGFALLAEYPALAKLFVLAAVSWFSLACLEGTFIQLIDAMFKLGQTAFGVILMYEMLLGFLLQSILFERVVKKLGRETTLRYGYVLQGIGLALTPFAPNIAVLVIFSSLYAIGRGIADPAMNLLCSEATPTERQGEMFGLLQSARNIGFLGGPSLGGYLFGVWRALPYLVAGVVSLVASSMALKVEKPGISAET